MVAKVKSLLAGTPAENAAAESPVLFAEGLCFYKMVWIFVIGCVIGYLIETVIIYISHGHYMNRAGMVWGPFNQVYGFGAVLLSLVLMPMAGKGSLPVFLVGALLGGVFEYLCSFIQEKCFGSTSWDYTGYPTNIGGRTNIFYMLFWGVLALAFTRFIYPALSGLIERIQPQWGAVLTWGLVIFFAANLFVSAIAVTRWNDRTSGARAQHPVAHILDDRFHDERMESIYPEMVKTASADDKGGDYDDAA